MKVTKKEMEDYEACAIRASTLSEYTELADDTLMDCVIGIKIGLMLELGYTPDQTIAIENFIYE